MNVKPNSATTPQALLRSSVTTNSMPSIAANISSGVMIGAERKRPAKLICMPTNAPAIVGSIDSASSQYVLRRTVFCAIGSEIPPLPPLPDDRGSTGATCGRPRHHRFEFAFHGASKVARIGPSNS